MTAASVATAAPAASAAGWNGATSGLLSAAAITQVLIMLPEPVYALEQYSFPKELALHIAALALLVATPAVAKLRVTTTDMAVAAFLALAVAMLGAHAVNPWLGARIVAVNLSAWVVFRFARDRLNGRMNELGWTFLAMAALTTAVVLADAVLDIGPSALPHRGPAGSLGHRNVAAHLLTILAPIIVWIAIADESRARRAIALNAIAGITWSLVLSRSRAAWLGAFTAVVVAGLLIGLSHIKRRHSDQRLADSRIYRRWCWCLAAILIGGAASIVIPNRLSWASATPFRDSLRTVVEYRSGSGQGRVIQYHNTIRMWLSAPIVGVGAGNWSVHYPRFATPHDPSYTPESFYEVSRIPNSDVIAVLAQTGIVGMALLLVPIVILSTRVARRASAPVQDAAMPSALWAAVGASLAAIIVMAALDFGPATLPTEAMAVALVFAVGSEGDRSGLLLTSTRRVRWMRRCTLAMLGFGIALAMSLTIGAVRFQFARTAEELIAATTWSPGDYQLQVRAGMLLRGERCSMRRPVLQRAHRLFPHNMMPLRLWDDCPGPLVP